MKELGFSLGILSLICLFSISCENDLAEVREAVSKDKLQMEVAKDVEMLYSDSAIVKARVAAPLMHRFLDKRDPRQEFPEGLRVEFLTPKGRVQSYLTAKFAIRYENKNEVIVRDSVVWKSPNQERLETEELIWDEQKEKVYSNKFVKITKPDEKIYGYGFEANQDFTRWKINAIEGELKVDGLTDELN